MQEVNERVTVIIPAFNAAQFIEDTISSVEQQSYANWDLVVVDDGSTDQTAEIVRGKKSDRILLISQSNAGVSAARNLGLQKAEGRYVLFLDADDLLTPAFLEERISFLRANSSFGFVGGIIETFPVEKGYQQAAAQNPVNEILFFKDGFATVPSNYVIKRDSLIKNGILFNTTLSSTADRFFIMHLSQFTKGGCIQSLNSRLLYRITEQSMSHTISPKLVLDNEKYYYELINAGMVPAEIKRKFRTFYFFSLALSFAKIGYWVSFTKYLCRSLMSSPAQFCKQFFKRLFSPK